MANLSITPAVLRWAIDSSGVPVEQVSAKAGADVRVWLKGAGKPTLGQLRSVAALLRRPVATFFLPKPPEDGQTAVQFRHPPDIARDGLNPDERRVLREALRQQSVLSWVLHELGADEQALPQSALKDDPAKVAVALREWLGISTETQDQWSSAAFAFRAWRAALEARGLIVFAFPMGPESCRGFSIWESRAPLITVNTAWSTEARIFSLVHELGHLVTRTSSACAEGGAKLGAATDPIERWCERFAACVLMPADALEAILRAEAGWSPGRKIGDLSVAGRVARRFRVSLRSAALRLIEANVAGWDLYRAIPPSADMKKQGGRSSEPRFRATVRREQFGRRATSLYFRAVDADVLNRSDMIDYLDVSDTDLDEIHAALNDSSSTHA